jgi:hypothetical protein
MTEQNLATPQEVFRDNLSLLQSEAQRILVYQLESPEKKLHARTVLMQELFEAGGHLKLTERDIVKHLYGSILT